MRWPTRLPARFPFGLSLLVLLIFVACSGGDHLDTPMQSVQRIEDRTWGSGATVNVTHVTPSRVTLSWPSASGCTGQCWYRVFRDGVVVTYGQGTSPSATDYSVTAGQHYAYAISAVSSEGETAEADRLSVTVDTPSESAAPAWPSGATMSVLRVGRHRAELSWPAGTDDYGEQHYEVRRRAVGTSDWSVVEIYDSADTSVQQRTAYGLNPAGAYEFKVVLSDREGHLASPEIPSVTLTALSAEAAFSWESGAALSPEATSRSEVRLAWTGAPVDAAYFQVERDMGEGMTPWSMA